MRVRFHLDEHVPFAIAEGLRRRSIDVTCTNEAGLAGVTDEEQVAFATDTGRVLVTQDADFLRLHGLGRAHSGIVYHRQGTIPIGELLRRLVLIHDLLEPEEMRNRVEFL